MTATAEPDEWVAELEQLTRSAGATVTRGFGDITVTVPSAAWTATLLTLREDASLVFFDWLSAVDEGQTRFTLFCHLYDPATHRHVLVQTALERPRVDSATSIFRGAAWHERETAEMFGIEFVGHPSPKRLLLSDEFEGHPLRKDFVLTARASKSWPGAKEPGESGEGSPSRRKIQPPGVPDPSWGPREAGSADE
jgi:NADH-quinone oxidoreductase subunit C